MQVKFGTYIGNGSGASITGVGFAPDLVMVKNINTTGDTYWRVTGMATNKSAPTRSDLAFVSNGILSLDADGFTYGTNAAVCGNTNTMVWMAVKDNGAGDFKVGNYTGDNTDGKAITGLGFQPNFVFIKSDSTIVGAAKFSTNTKTSMHFGGPDRTDSIESLDADGFTVNNGSSSGGNLVNVNAVSHCWFAMKNVTGYVSVFNYTGNGSDGRDITTPNFAPGFVYIKGNNSSTPKIRYYNQSGDNSQSFDETQGTNKIQSFISTGFQIGSDSSVNTTSNEYYGIAIGVDFTTGTPASAHIFGDECIVY